MLAMTLCNGSDKTMATLGGEQVPPDSGGPAPRLAKAPDQIRCQRVIATPGGGSTRCSRFTIKLLDGSRDRFCVSHSRTERAEELRAKGAKAQEDARQAWLEKRWAIINNLAPAAWHLREHLEHSRHALTQHLILGNVSVAEAQVLRAIINDAEQSARVGDREWPKKWIDPFHVPDSE
jgi:hypothetical protein